ncbi:hypothetical protein M422DRAFT_32332 [Sphaerobolus stellatus SS14]|uniref:3-oxoacyl-[acyl-carrier-protein] reductase n=1 Tax=Sphaerobolus stellatus (strain SS14) TaxID=990650 RepID=A0A0C9UAW0_SPHS4|nr:hypothetical protein M422DRAFT_32332 [Sphaerobolus stellatus SS14]
MSAAAAASAVRRSILVVAGIGDGSGTGASTARLFAKNGYRVAVISRSPEATSKTAEGINSDGGEAAAFPIKSYTHEEIHSAFNAIKGHWKDSDIRVGVFNAGSGVWKGFLDITEEDLKKSLDTNIVAAFGFARESILAFKDLPLLDGQKKGTLIFTGATASVRGNKVTSAFAAGKHGVRALSQSLAKEFGPQDIHVAHAIIDGGILTNLTKSFNKDPEWEENVAKRLDPNSIAKSYLYLAGQDRSAWTWELDLRPAHEKW